MPDPRKLRKLGAWYREFADRAGEPAIWAMRLRTAEQLEAEADRIEAHSAQLRLHEIATGVGAKPKTESD
jgi:hypothetical protein